MGLRRSLNFGERIFFAVFPFHGFFGVDGRAGLKAEVVGKPSKDFFLSSISEFDLKPEECLMIGDVCRNLRLAIAYVSYLLSTNII